VLPSTGPLAGQCPYCLLEAGLVQADANPPETDRSENRPDSVLPAGCTIGPYRIETLLGAGGMGRVYRAVDTRFGRKVAIKFLSAAVADAAGRRRFQREAQMASSLNHPHILTVHDVGEFEGREYLVTEFVDGGTLADWARRQKRRPREIAALLVGVADALAVAHEAGILHRDIKPANVLVSTAGYAKVADFGLAKLAAGAGVNEEAPTLTETMTRPGVIMGTIAYMSPEQASGRRVDARSDIFSFGVLLFELLAGRRPFAGKTDLELLQTIIHGAPQPLGEEHPLTLRLILEKALEKDPGDRYQSMREIAVDLRRFAKSKADAALPAALRPRRARLPWVAVGVLAVATAAWEALRSAAPANPLEGARLTRVTEFEAVEAAISPDGRFVAFLSDHDGAFDVWVTQAGAGRPANLTQGKVALPGPIRSVGFSGDGSEVWLGGGDVGLRLRLLPLAGGAPRNFLGDQTVNLA
jgi:predicted Ser/Thr protein kinase